MSARYSAGIESLMEGTKDIPGLTFKKKMYMEFWIKKVLKKFYTMLVWYLLVV
jgi:hypothetical protein